MGYFTSKSILKEPRIFLNSWLREQPSLLRKRLKKKKEKKRKRKRKEKGERGELIFQAWFEHLKHFAGCNFHPRSL